jgi:cation diffusion facilitator CzcD-associated flavoprotein CzcO
MTPHYLQFYLSNIVDQEINEEDIIYNTTVQSVILLNEDCWQVIDQNDVSYKFKGIVVCSGNVHIPQFHNDVFKHKTIKQIHSMDYKGLETIQGKNVIVIGSGQSAIDIITTGIIHAKKIIHCTRKIPGWRLAAEKNLEGVKRELIIYDFINKVPKAIKGLDKTVLLIRKTYSKFLRLLLPQYISKYLFSKKIFNTTKSLKLYNWEKRFSLKIFPVTKKFLWQYANSRKVVTKKAIKDIKGNNVIFEDGTIDKSIDIIIHATGYQQSFHFIKQKDLIFNKENVQDALHGLYFGFLPKIKGIYFIGQLYPFGPHWVLFTIQAKLVAACIKSKLSHDKLIDLFKNDCSALKYSVFNYGKDYSSYVDINRYLKQGKRYLKIIN